ERFSLLDLQRCIEAIGGQPLHKQNFRRLIESQNLLEETGDFANGPGRPAKLFRFRSAIRDERAMTGSRPPLSRP
ncbi:NrtR DNA-binding winged helix domain-containing protein, partial [Acidiphilium sp. PM]